MKIDERYSIDTAELTLDEYQKERAHQIAQIEAREEAERQLKVAAQSIEPTECHSERDLDKMTTIEHRDFHNKVM